jgi:hypothetical protein
MQNAKKFFPVCLFLILLLSLFSFLIPGKANPETFGKTTIGSNADEQAANTKASNIFSLPKDGYVTKITLYLNKWRYAPSDAHVKCAIYDVDATGAPTSLRGTTEEIVVNWTTAKWQDFNLPSPVFLSAEKYRLTYMWDNPIVTYQDTGSTNCYADKSITYSQEPTDPFGTVAKWRSYEKSIYATYTPVDRPTYSNIAHNTTVAGASVKFSCRWSDETGLSGYIFGTNNTGVAKNETWTAFSVNPDWANVTMTLNPTEGVRVEYWWYANDTSDNWSYTGINYLIVTAAPDPSAAYIYRDGNFYYFNGSDAGFYFRFRGDGSSTGFTVMSHSNYGYNLACEMTGFAPLFWEYVDVLSGEQKQNEGGALTVLRNASDFSLVKIHCPFSKMNHTIYYGFWKDKPYVWVYISRVVNEDMIPINAQTCHMWSQSLTQSWYTDYTGQIVNYNYTGAGEYAYWFNNPLFAALDNGTMNHYPFMSHYDESINVTVGEIYTYATPNVRKDLRMWAFEFGTDYIETQIDWSTAGSFDTMYWREGTVMGLEWLFFIKSDAPNSEGNIADYSRQLLNNATNVWQDVKNDFWSATHLPSRSGHQNYGVRGHTPYVASGFEYSPRAYYIPYAFMTSPTNLFTGMPYDVPITSKLMWRDNGGWIELDDREISGTSYETINQTDSIIGRISWDKGDYTVHEHVKAFSTSDKLIFYGNVTLDVNGSAWQSFFELHFNNIGDCVKINDLEYDLRWEDPVYGWMGIYIKANTGSITEFSDHLSIVLLDNTTPQSYSLGESWKYNFTIWGHAGNASSMSGFFDLPTLKYKRLWYNYALDNNDFAFETMSEYCVISVAYSSDTLTMYLHGTTNGDKNVEVFINDKGQPNDVKVDDQSVNFEYDSASKVCSFNVSFAGAHKKVVIEWLESILIDEVFVTDARCDVGSVETVGFHARWAQSNSSIVGGSVYVNETEYITNATGWMNLTSSLTVGKLTWVVTGVNCSGVTAYTQTASNPSIIWDQIQITLDAADNRINVGSNASIMWTGIYEYDSTSFAGGISLNDTTLKNTVGRYNYRVQNIQDNEYSLTKFTSNSIYIIFDRVSVTLSVEDSRIDIGSMASIVWTGFYEYDSTAFTGTVTLNDTGLTKTTVGRYGFTTQSVTDPLYGLTNFTSNEVYCIWDRVNIQITITDERIGVGSTASLSWTGTYEYDGANFSGTATYNDTLTRNTVGKYGYMVSSISDPMYGLTTFTSNEIFCVWDRVKIVEGGVSNAFTNINQNEKVWFRAVYDYDNVSFDNTKGTLYVNGTVMAWSSSDNRWEKSFSFDTEGLRTFKVSGVSDTQYGLTSINDEAGAQSITWIELLMVTSLSIFLSPSPALVGFKVQIIGQLTCQNSSGISNVPVLLSYNIPSVETWDVIASVTTGMNGSFSVTWFTWATGNYVIKAVYAGDPASEIMGTETSVALVIADIEKQIFSVSSNSTISALYFNSTAKEITFTVTGPNGTAGYIDMVLAKSLVPNMNSTKIFVDDTKQSYDAISLDDTWFIRITYFHSTHVIRMSLPPTSAPSGHISHELIMLLTVSIIAIAITFLILKTRLRTLLAKVTGRLANL